MSFPPSLPVCVVLDGKVGPREEMAWHQGAEANQTSRWDRPDGPFLLSTLQPTRHASLISPGAVTRTTLKSITKQFYSFIFTIFVLSSLLFCISDAAFPSQVFSAPNGF